MSAFTFIIIIITTFLCRLLKADSKSSVNCLTTDIECWHSCWCNNFNQLCDLPSPCKFTNCVQHMWFSCSSNTSKEHQQLLWQKCELLLFLKWLEMVIHVMDGSVDQWNPWTMMHFDEIWLTNERINNVAINVNNAAACFFHSMIFEWIISLIDGKSWIDVVCDDQVNDKVDESNKHDLEHLVAMEYTILINENSCLWWLLLLLLVNFSSFSDWFFSIVSCRFELESQSLHPVELE